MKTQFNRFFRFRVELKTQFFRFFRFRVELKTQFNRFFRFRVELKTQFFRFFRFRVELKTQYSNQIKKRKKSEYSSLMTTKRILVFPWWFKILAYILSFSIISVSITLVVFKGISLGDDNCTKWLTSFVVSVLGSCFIVQPIEVSI